MKITRNPTGTILGDLNNKLIEDLFRLIFQYMTLTEIMDVTYPESLGGVLSSLSLSLSYITITIEKNAGLAPDIFEEYLKVNRDGYDFPSR